MSYAGAPSVLGPTLPYSLALTRRGLPLLKPDGFEPHPSLAARSWPRKWPARCWPLPSWSTPICSCERPVTPGRPTESEAERAAALATALPSM